jgi:drug/metabolite transporter (DMT)-like permease
MNEPRVPAKKDRIDLLGAGTLIAFSLLLGLNQVMVKLVNTGMNPVFQAGLRSAAAFVPILAWTLWRRKRMSVNDGSLLPGLMCGLLFAFEFLFLFVALDYTTVGRASVMFYTMPVWVAIAAHFLIPGESLTRRRIAGLLLAVAGVILALARNDHPATQHALAGDLMALVAATGWAGIALSARVTRFANATIEMQLLYQLAVSAPVMLVLAPAFGPVFREMTPFLWGIFAFQVIAVTSVGFLVWFHILKIYPTSDMASFAFLAPLFGVLFGWLILAEQLTVSIVGALALVGAGIWLVNRRPQGVPGAQPAPMRTPAANTSAPPSTT